MIGNYTVAPGPTGATCVVIRACPFCGQDAETVVRIDALRAYQDGALAQEVFPNLLPAEREQIISGTHPECWF